MPPASSDRVPIERVSIVLPARDERETIAAALVAIASAIDRAVDEGDVPVDVTVVDDGSSDGTAEHAERVCSILALRSQVVRVDAGCVGAARRIGVDAATSRSCRPDRVWILSTDADSRVRPDWIALHLRHARSGAVAVSGIVDIVDDVRTSPLHARWWADYGAAIDGLHRHPYAHATNLGVRLDVYRSVGGFRDVSGEEDADLWRRLRLAGHDPVADARIVVDTSDRRVGRVARGFAHALDTLYPDVSSPDVSGARDPAEA